MRTTPALLTAALLLALAAGCTTSPDASSQTPTPTESTSPSVSASPSPTSADPRVLARANAEDAVRSYYALVDEVGSDPNTPASRLERVATSVELEVRQADLEQWRKDGWRKTGRTQVTDVVVQSVILDNSDPKAGLVPTVQVDVCYDVSDVDVLDSAGASVVSPDRADRAWERLHVANYDYDDDPDGGWRVAALETLEKAPCAGS
ncbi:hypothetical protein [Promicromonospora sp. AC04]|uniref:hypothetical protein n=1 Tax=Promicromonospora sp. AC04 TaxID=2135723 RepID=UPI0011B1E773|nr:hypothetical protein [Promicromonospora sp. AC04]